MFSYYHHTVRGVVLESLFTFCFGKEEIYLFFPQNSTYFFELKQYKCKQDGSKDLKREILNTSGI